MAWLQERERERERKGTGTEGHEKRRRHGREMGMPTYLSQPAYVGAFRSGVKPALHFPGQPSRRDPTAAQARR